ncbi:MAG: PEP-CTERM sorting domain-containing protein [Puniceicoccaceae bacterium]
MKKHIAFITAFLVAHLASSQITTVTPNPDHTSNPSGVWSYGWKATASGTFVLFDTYIPNGTYNPNWNTNVHQWYSSQDPNISATFNPTNSIQTGHATALIEMPPNSMMLHPGDTELAVMRYTAPLTGSYNFSGGFYDYSNSVNGVTIESSIFTGGITQWLTVVAYTGEVTSSPSLFNVDFVLTAGQTVDFQVANYGALDSDLTGFEVTVTSPVPEPSTYALISMGVLGLVLVLKPRFGKRAE